MPSEEEWKILMDYEKNRDFMIPPYWDMVRDISEIASSMIPSGNKRLRVLDLGSYIGLDAEKICDYLIEMGYEIDLYLVDILDDALRQARNRFANRKGINSVTALRRDFSQQGWEEGLPNDFDMAFSNLSTAGIPDKRSFYQSVYRLLKPKSPLVMGISVYLSDEAKSTEANALFEDECRKKMEAALGRHIPDSEFYQILDRWFGQDWYGGQQNQRHTLEQKLRWLREAGFSPADVYSEYINGRFSVIYGIKET